MDETYPPTLAAAQARIAAFRPAAYARTRNAIDGAVATALALAPEFKAANLKVPIHLALSCDEEVGCKGVRPLVAEGQTAIAGETIIADLRGGDPQRSFRVG